MKKLLYIILACLLFSANSLRAATTITDPDKVWTVPAVYAMDEEVTWYFDFASAKQVNDGEPLYMWIWAPTNPTGAPIPLNYNGDRVWSITMTPTTFFNMTVQQLFDNKEAFYFLIRDLDATKLTGTLSLPKTDFIKNFSESGKIMDYAPSDFRLGGTITILFNSNLAEGFNPAPSTVHMHGALNDWDKIQGFDAWLPDIRAKTKFKHLGNGIYKKDFVPQTYFGVAEDYDMQNIVFVIAKYNGNDAAPDWAGVSPDFKILAPGIPEPPPAKLYFFPLKVSINDIWTITRENNNRGQRLNYTITGGTKTLFGEMDGTMIRQRVFINLAKEFKGMQLDKLHVLIKDQNGSTIHDGDISLANIDKPSK